MRTTKKNATIGLPKLAQLDAARQRQTNKGGANMRRPSYMDAVLWIAINDNPGDNYALGDLESSMTVTLVADLFCLQRATVATDVWRARNDETHPWFATVEQTMNGQPHV